MPLTPRTEKYSKAMEFFSQPPHHSWKKLMVAICLVQLGDYLHAREQFSAALRDFLEDRFWHGTSEPNWLIDTYMLADQSNLFSQVSKEIEAYKLDYRGRALIALYAYATICLLSGKDEEAQGYAQDLLTKPKVKDTFAMGKTIEAISAQNQEAFDAALDGLLKAHRGMAKFGGLRETPEGFLCLPA
ncbi:MAG: hypothetical protein P8129_22310, partial [Anaerolineae bacterium]